MQEHFQNIFNFIGSPDLNNKILGYTILQNSEYENVCNNIFKFINDYKYIFKLLGIPSNLWKKLYSEYKKYNNDANKQFLLKILEVYCNNFRICNFEKIITDKIYFNNDSIYECIYNYYGCMPIEIIPENDVPDKIWIDTLESFKFLPICNRLQIDNVACDFSTYETDYYYDVIDINFSSAVKNTTGMNKINCKQCDLNFAFTSPDFKITDIPNAQYFLLNYMNHWNTPDKDKVQYKVHKHAFKMNSQFKKIFKKLYPNKNDYKLTYFNSNLVIQLNTK